MVNYLNNLARPLLRTAREIGRLAQERGLEAFVVGGCVRDLILGVPVKELDILVSGDAVGLARRFADVAKGKAVVYNQFGTATVSLQDGRMVDFATLRKERYPSPGALPVVSSGILKDDLLRRDFTMNAMAIAIDPVNFGRLIDLYGGFEDLKKKLVRVLHDRSFIDDPTRMLRAVRFEQRFGFRIEPVTLKLFRSAVAKGAFKTIKPQRFFDEFRKNLKEDKAFENLKRFKDLDVLKVIDRRIDLNASKTKLFKAVSRWLGWAEGHLSDWIGESRWLVFWMALCDGLSRPSVSQNMVRFAFKGTDRDKVLNAMDLKDVVNELAHRDRSAGESFGLLRSRSLEELIFLGSRSSTKTAERRIKTHLLKWRHVVLKINGHDLKGQGVPSGKAFAEILDDVLARAVEGRCRSRSQQLAYALDSYKRTQY